MNLGAIIHRSSDNFAYSLDKDTLQINIKTGYDILSVNIVYGDPFKGGILGGDWKWGGITETIKDVTEMEYHKVWSINVKPEFKRLKYYFEIFSQDEKMLFYEDGFFTEEDIKNKSGIQCFTKPWLNQIDINETPNWVNNTVWYQIFLDRFCNGDSSINQRDTQIWNSKKPKNEDIYGGDLRGIINKLGYIKELGINGIYLTPIFKANSTHKYDTIDYFDVDASFGNKKVFKEFVEKAHKNNIKVMLDGVFNHSGKFFEPWQDVVKNGDKSKYFDWFMVNKLPIDENLKSTEDKSFYSFAFVPDMPKLNTNNKEVVDYILSICDYWVKEFDIDGWRIDVANEISHHLCKQIRKNMKSIKPDFYILGEIWHDSIEWLRGDEFDSVMNYPLTTAINDFWVNKNMTKKQFEHKVNRCYQMYMEQTNDVLFNLLDSHDTDRLITRVKNEDIFWQQMGLLFTSTGSPCIFYGTEIMLEGAHDPDCRACMPWNDIENGAYDKGIQKLRKLINLRRSEKAFIDKKIIFMQEIKNDRVIEYIKQYKNEKIEIIINASDVDIKIDYKSVLFENLLVGDILQKSGIAIIK